MSAITPGSPREPGGLIPEWLHQRWLIPGAGALSVSLLGLVLFFVIMGGDDAVAPVGESSSMAAGAEMSVPIAVVEGSRGSVLPFVSISINGRGPYLFALDTGASRTVISAELVRELGLDKADESMEVTGVAGTTEAELAIIEDWRIGDVTLPETTAMIVRLPEVSEPSDAAQSPGADAIANMQGLLGSDVLSAFGAILIDYDDATLLLRPE